MSDGVNRNETIAMAIYAALGCTSTDRRNPRKLYEACRQIARFVEASLDGDGHASDCAVHNAPALPVGPCDCGAEPQKKECACLRPGGDPTGNCEECSPYKPE